MTAGGVSDDVNRYYVLVHAEIPRTKGLIMQYTQQLEAMRDEAEMLSKSIPHGRHPTRNKSVLVVSEKGIEVETL